MISTYFNKSATRTRKSVVSTNDFGEPTFSDNTSASFDCALQPDNGDYTVEESGKVITSTHRLYCAITVDITQGDIITIESEKYKVLAVMDDAGRGNHLKIMLRIVS